MSYKLQKPCTNEQKIEFIVLHNHRYGRLIQETETAVFALEPWEQLENDTIVDNSEEYEAQRLSQAKVDKYTEANSGAKAYLESSEAVFELRTGASIEATDGNIGKLSAYALSFLTGALGSDDVVYWNTKEDTTIALTQADLAAVLQGLGQVQAQVWNIKFPAYLARLEAATTADEVDAIVIDYSLPVAAEDVSSDVTETPAEAREEEEPSGNIGDEENSEAGEISDASEETQS